MSTSHVSLIGLPRHEREVALSLVDTLLGRRSTYVYVDQRTYDSSFTPKRSYHFKIEEPPPGALTLRDLKMMKSSVDILQRLEEDGLLDEQEEPEVIDDQDLTEAIQWQQDNFPVANTSLAAIKAETVVKAEKPVKRVRGRSSIKELVKAELSSQALVHDVPSEEDSKDEADNTGNESLDDSVSD